MAVNALTDGADTSTNPSTTASISPTSGATVYAFVGTAETAGEAGQVLTGSVAISGLSGTWEVVSGGAGFVSGRRNLHLLRCTDWSGSGALTITYTDDSSSAGAWTETMWGVFEVTNATIADPDDAPVTATTTGATSLAIGDVGTPDADDIVICGFIIEGGTVSATLGQGTELVNRGSGSDVRTLVVGYDPTPFDETPSVSWSGTESAIGIGMIVNVTPAAGGAEGSLTHGKLIRGGLLRGGVLV